MATMLASAGRIVHRLLQRNGMDADALFLECGLDPLKLTDPRARYPIGRNRALWRLAYERIQDPCWGLMAGEVWRQTDFHALGCGFLASRTLESALMRLERYFRIVTEDVALRVETEGDHCQHQLHTAGAGGGHSSPARRPLVDYPAPVSGGLRPGSAPERGALDPPLGGLRLRGILRRPGAL